MSKVIFAKINSSRKKEFQILTRIIRNDDSSLSVTKTGPNVPNIYANIVLYSKIYKDNVVLPLLEGTTIESPLVEGELLVDAYKRGDDEKVLSILHLLLDKEENTTSFVPSDGFASLFPNVSVPERTISFKISNVDMILENIVLSKEKTTIIDLEWIFDFAIPKDFVLYRILKDALRIDHRESFKEKFIKSFNMKMDENVLEKMDEDFLNYVNEESLGYKFERDESYIASALNDDQKEIGRLNARIKELGSWAKNLDDTTSSLNKRIFELQEEVETKNKHISNVISESKRNEETLVSNIETKDKEIKTKDESIASLNQRVEELSAWGKSLDETTSSLNKRIFELQEEVEIKNKHIELTSKEAKDNEALLSSVIERKDSEIKKKDESIVSLNKRVDELGEWGHSLDLEVESLDKRINELQSEVEIKNKHIDSLSLESKQNEEKLSSIIRSKEKEIEIRDESIVSLNKRIEELGDWGKKLDQEILSLNGRINELQSEVETKNKHIDSLFSEAKQNEEKLSFVIEESKKKDEEINRLSGEIVSLKDEVERKIQLAVSLKEETNSLTSKIKEKESEIISLNENIKSLESTIAENENNILVLKETVVQRDILIASLNKDIEGLNSKIFDLEESLRRNEIEIARLNDDLTNRSSEIESLNQKAKEQFERILILQDEEEERNVHIKKLDGEIDVLRERSNKLHEIENSTFYKFAKGYYKVRDFFIPMGSKRKMFLKLLGKMIRHPIWTIKHLTPENVRKFKKYSKSEGLARALERTDVYQGNTAEVEYAKKLDLISMKPHDEYPVLEFPKFKKVKVSIVIPVYNQFSYTYGCLAMILKNAGNVPYEVIIGDDCSTDETKDISACAKNIKIARTKVNSRFVLNNNNAAKKAVGEYIYFLNNDTNVQPGFLESLVETIESDSSIGMVGSKLVYPNGMLQEAGGILWRDGSAWNYGYKSDANASEYNYRKETDYISGAAIMIKRSLWEEIGGFDTRFVPAYCEDSDLAFEVRKHGYKVVYDPFSVVVHYEGISNGTDINSGLKKYQVDNTKKFYEKWKDVLKEHYPNAENVFVARERSYKKKTILVIDHYVPTYDKDAGSRTVFGYLKLFVKMGYNVKFMGENFYQSEPYTTTLQKMGIEVLYGPYYYHNWKNWIKEVGENIDLVMFNRPHITRVFIDDVKASCPKAKFMYYGHDLHYMRLNREYEITGSEEANKDAAMWKEREWELFKKVDLVLYPSNVEEKEIKSVDPSINAKVLQPYLFDDIKDAKYKFEERKDIMFVGGFRHGPNVDGIMWFIKEVFPKILEKHPDVNLTVAGAFPPQELLDSQNEHIKVTGFISDEELNKLYKSVRMIVVPLRYGAGIKGKVIEAMYNGVPVVTTSCGAEGIDMDALIVDESLLKVNDLYEDKEKLIELSKKEYEFMLGSYSMNKAEESFKSMVDELNEK